MTDTNETDVAYPTTGHWVKLLPPPHVCDLPTEFQDTFDYGSIWHCDICNLEWVWSNGGGWLAPEELERRRAENDAAGIPNDPTNPHAHPFFRLPGRPVR